MEKISRMSAIKKFMESGPSGRPVESTELVAYKKADDGSFQELAQMCAAALGYELEVHPQK